MIKELIHDPIFLSLKSEVATKEDIQVAEDLLDTLVAHKEGCVGMAANMIGVSKRISPLIMMVHIWLCLTLRLSKKQSPTKPRRAAFPYSEVLVSASVIII